MPRALSNRKSHADGPIRPSPRGFSLVCVIVNRQSWIENVLVLMIVGICFGPVGLNNFRRGVRGNRQTERSQTVLKLVVRGRHSLRVAAVIYIVLLDEDLRITEYIRMVISI